MAATAVNIVFAWLVHQSFRLDLVSMGLAAALLIIAALQMRGALVRARRLREIEEDMDDLRAANVTVRSALDETKKKVADVTLSIVQKNEEREKKIAGELQIIEGLVRNFASNAVKLKDPAAPIAGPRASGTNHANGLSDPSMLETIRASLEENRVDLYLQPIVSLPQRKLRFYEALSRLRAEDGTVIMPAQYIKVAAPAGLMSVVDNLLLFRCVQIVRRLTQKTPRHRRVLQHLRRHAGRRGVLPAVPRIHAPQPRPRGPDRVRVRPGPRWLHAGATGEANLAFLANLGFRAVDGPCRQRWRSISRG